MSARPSRIDLAWARALAPIRADAEAVKHILDDASVAMRASAPPQALLVVTARFWRVMRKYEGVAYALILNAVALLQTFSLVAHTMGLAGCPLGGGNAELFAVATGADFFDETSVAEFALGTPAGAANERIT
jgi:SagB-type dehydrogenase family enzyme